MTSPHQVTKDFERALCEYTGAPFAVAVNSCTMALLLAVRWHVQRGAVGMQYQAPEGIVYGEKPFIEIPKRTYVGVPMSIMHAGGHPKFRDEDWEGMYQLKPLPVWDSARWLTCGMYRSNPRGPSLVGMESGSMLCVSFHASKTLGDSQGGAILHDSQEADVWLRRARFDGRTEGVAPRDDDFDMIGWHCYLSPDVSARLLWKLASLPQHNQPLPSDDYPDLSQMEIFK